MPPRNICKFTAPACSENLQVSCFVLETDTQVMRALHTLKHTRIILVNKGESEITIGTETLPLRKGDLLFCFENEQIHFSGSDGFQYLYIDFGGLRADVLRKRFYISPNNRYFTDFDGLIPLWEEGLLRASEHTIDLVSESLVLYTFSRLSPITSPADNTLNRILQITEEQFNNFDLSITDIAKELGYHPKYLSHLFKEKTNKTYSEYLRCIRIKYAVSLFDNGIDSVKNVALLSGFSDPLYFSTVFKRTMGLSPKEYLSKKQQLPPGNVKRPGSSL